DRIKLIKTGSPYTSIFKDFEFKIPHSFEELKSKLIENFPQDEKGIIKVLNTIRDTCIQAYAFLGEKTKFEAIKNTPIKYPKLIPGMLSTVYGLIWKNIKTPKLRTILGQLYNYYSDDIKKLNLIYFCATYSYINESYWISGTASTLSHALKDIIVENGGNVYTRKKVTKILFKDKKAIGIRVNDNEEFFSDITVCNSPLKPTIENLIEKKNIPLLNRIQALNVKPSTSIFALYVGLNIDVRDIGIKDFCYFLNEIDDLKDVRKNGKTIAYETRSLVIASYNIIDDSLCQKGKSVVSICVVDTMDNWEYLKNDKEEYKKEKERIANIILDRVDRKFKGFKDAIDVLEIGTPITMEKYSNNPGGAVYGACQRISQSNLLRFPNEIKNRNLYFAGAWVSPGGGLSGVMISGQETVKLILKKYKIDPLYEKFIEPRPKEGANI
ncbi:MAG TPA: FAD-dependent oxidoreductase, partial [Spirochaetota bacterium]|nr:FAD-dependent oxidoreductase [Spirochaetota bacterium]